MPRRPMRGSRPARTAPERGRHLPPKAGRPTYGNDPPLRGMGIDRPGDDRRCYCEGKGCGREVAVRAHAQAGAAKPTPAGTGRMAGHAAGVGKRRYMRGKAIGL